MTSPNALTPTTTEKAQEAGFAILKGTLGLIPGGGVAAELLGVVIPNKRMERVEQMLVLFSEKVKDIEADVLHQRMREPDFEELFEQGCYVAAQSIATEKLKGIAHILAAGVKSDDKSTGLKQMLSVYERLTELDMLLLLALDEKHEEARKKRDFKNRSEFAEKGYMPLDECVSHATQWFKGTRLPPVMIEENTINSLQRLESENLVSSYRIDNSTVYIIESQSLFYLSKLGMILLLYLRPEETEPDADW